jgi:hypothetical protein
MNRSSHLSNDARLEDALRNLPRAQPASDLSARIIAQLPQNRATPHARWLGALTVSAALLGIVLAYQTAFDLHTRGAFDLVAYYTAQPAIVATYPREAFGALAQAIPWLTVLASASVLGLALVLVYRLAANVRSMFWQRA